MGSSFIWSIHTKETRSERDTCTPMFIAALFVIARTWKQPRCPSADEWTRKLWYIYTMEYYSAIKETLDESERGASKSQLKTQLFLKNYDHGIWSHHFMANKWGNNGNSKRLFSWAPKSLQMVTAAMKLKDTCFLEEKQ